MAFTLTLAGLASGSTLAKASQVSTLEILGINAELRPLFEGVAGPGALLFGLADDRRRGLHTLGQFCVKPPIRHTRSCFSSRLISCLERAAQRS